MGVEPNKKNRLPKNLTFYWKHTLKLAGAQRVVAKPRFGIH
jgi:hypothetical protein